MIRAKARKMGGKVRREKMDPLTICNTPTQTLFD
jgi:hypothetical protein